MQGVPSRLLSYIASFLCLGLSTLSTSAAPVFVQAISNIPVAAVSVPGGTAVSITATGIVSIANNDIYANDANGTIVQAPSVNTGAYDYFFTQAPVGPPVVGGKKFQNTSPYGSVVLPSAPYGSLLAGFSTSGPPAAWFLVGTSTTLTAPPGIQTLYLVVNDCSTCYGDNSGAFAVTIQTPVTLFSDLNGTFTPGGYIVGQYSPGSTFVISAGFTVVGQNYTLNEIQALLSFSSGVNNMLIKLYTDSGGVPGALLESWNLVNALTPSPSIVTLTSVVAPTLLAGQRYWITAGMADPTSVGVWWINPIGDGLQGFASASLNGAPFTPGANTVFGFHAFAVTGNGSAGTPPAATLFGGASSSANSTLLVAEPVNSATGNYYSSHADLAVRGRGLSFRLTRHYNSLDPYSGPLGNGWTHTYNVFLIQNPQTGQASIKQADGSTISFVAVGGGTYAPATVGVNDTLVQNPDGSFSLTRKNQTRLTFSPAGRLIMIADRNSNTQALTYNSGNLSSVTDTTGRTYQFSYDSSNHLVLIVDPIGRTVRYSYDASGNLTSCQDALGGLTQYAYDANSRLLSGTDSRGVVYVQNTYDSSGRVITQKNGKGLTTTFAYDTPSPGTTTVTDPVGNAAQYVYDSSLRIVHVINAQSGTTSYAYDGNNNRTAITNANGNKTQFTYDRNGNVTSITNPLGNTAAFTYDSKNDLLTATNPTGKITMFSYDTKGNLTTVQDTLGNTTALAHDAFGELLSRTDALGNISSLTYDANGDATKVTNALGNTTSFGYDGISRVTSVTDGNGHTFVVTYDALGRRTKTTNALGNQTQYTYDQVGNLLKVIDADGNSTAYQYDNVNNLVTAADALGKNTTYGYDADNNRVSFTNAKGSATNYAYDSLNRRTKVTDPLGLVNSYSYDGVGNVVSATDANGNTDTFSYDAVNRPVNRTYADGNIISYSYDASGNRTAMTDSHGTTSYSYDALNQVTTVNSPSGNAVKYAYDGVGHRSALTYPDGRIVTYAYDPARRLSQVTDWLSRKTTYAYDPAGNRVATTMGNGANSSFTYDNANRLLTIVNRSGTKVQTAFTYSLDAVGNRTQVSDVSGGLTRYGYDGLNRLTSWTVPSGQVTSYGYDAVGNRTSMSSSAGITAYTYDADDRLLTAGTSSFTYDGDGNRLTKATGATTVSYTFDALNRLKAASGGGIAAQYQYDGDGNRISQQAGAASYQYSVDVARRNPAVLNENGSDGNIDFQYGLTILSGSSSTLEQFYQADGVGSTADVTDATDALKASYTYDPWGKLLNPIDALGTKDKFKFTGEALDPQTGLYYLRARYYDPTVGQFISKDTFQGLTFAPITTNRHIYASDNPVKYTDKSGRASEVIGSGDRTLSSGAISVGLFSILSGFSTSSGFSSSSGFSTSSGFSSSSGFSTSSDLLPLSGFGLRDSNDPPLTPDDCGPAQFSSPGSGFCGAPQPTTRFPQLPTENISATCGDLFFACTDSTWPEAPEPTEPTFNPGDYNTLHPPPQEFPIGGDDDWGDDDIFIASSGFDVGGRAIVT